MGGENAVRRIDIPGGPEQGLTRVHLDKLLTREPSMRVKASGPLRSHVNQPTHSVQDE